MLERGADVVIVGRGVTAETEEKVAAAAKAAEFRRRAWDALMQRITKEEKE